MNYNNYKLNKKYPINSLKHYWFTKEKKNTLTIVENDSVIFKKMYLDSLLLSKVNFCRRAIIRAKIVYNILDKYFLEEYQNFGLPIELQRKIISFLGYNDVYLFKENKLYSEDEINYIKKLNTLGYDPNHFYLKSSYQAIERFDR